MCGYFCIGFTDFMLKGKSLLEYTNLFYPNDYKNNNKIIKRLLLWIYFKKVSRTKSIVPSVKRIKKSKSLKCHIFGIKHYFFLVFVTNVKVKMKKHLNKNYQLNF